MTIFFTQQKALEVLNNISEMGFDVNDSISKLSSLTNEEYSKHGFCLSPAAKHKTLRHLVIRTLKFHETDSHNNVCGITSPSFATLKSKSCEFKTESQLIGRIRRLIAEVEAKAEARRKAKTAALNLAQELANPYCDVFGEELVFIDATGPCRHGERFTAQITIKYNGYSAVIGEHGFLLSNQHTLKKDESHGELILNARQLKAYIDFLVSLQD